MILLGWRRTSASRWLWFLFLGRRRGWATACRRLRFFLFGRRRWAFRGRLGFLLLGRRWTSACGWLRFFLLRRRRRATACGWLRFFLLRGRRRATTCRCWLRCFLWRRNSIVLQALLEYLIIRHVRGAFFEWVFLFFLRLLGRCSCGLGRGSR